MVWQVLSEDGRALDAHLDLDGEDVVLHSRGGARGAAGLRNADYGPALRLLLERLSAAGARISAAWVDSARVQHLPEDDRTILTGEETGLSPAEQFRLLSTRMKNVGRRSEAAGGNSTRRIRLRTQVAPGVSLSDILGVRPVRRDTRSEQRLPAELLRRVTAEHVWRAVEHLVAGQLHPFGDSLDFDLIADDDIRLPPKAVFGLAASEALGFEVRPVHFTGGLGTIAFQTLGEAGYEIVPKRAPPGRNGTPPDPDDQAWAEGNPKLAQHLRRERARGLSAAKKAAFRREHGRLFCERCSFDPVEAFGDVGQACIEAHHASVRVGEMEEGHRTRLEDLQCLCANCHRLVHAQLRLAASG